MYCAVEERAARVAAIDAMGRLHPLVRQRPMCCGQRMLPLIGRDERVAHACLECLSERGSVSLATCQDIESAVARSAWIAAGGEQKGEV